MLFDWFTTIAQIVNFVILVVVLKYLLYDRIVRAIERRREAIEREREEAQEARTEAEQEAERHRAERRELDERRQELLGEAREEAERRREELLDEAREEVEAKRREWLRSLEREQERLVRDVTGRVGETALDVAGRALADLMDEDLERHMVRSFVDRLGALPEQRREELAEVLTSSTERDEQGPVVVASFGLDEEQRRRVADAVSEHLDVQVSSFEHDEDLVGGLRLMAGGRGLGWTIDDYLEDLRNDLREELDRGGQEVGP